jgi:hypothetical protein
VRAAVSIFCRWIGIFVVFAAGLILSALLRPVQAVPAFAQQTGQPRSTCHIGSFGPQLTPFGRAFKIGGYTLDGGQGRPRIFRLPR